MIQEDATRRVQRVYSIAEFVKFYGLGRTRVYQELSSGRLKAVRVGSRRLVRHDDAERWLASLPETPQESK